jgi:type IV pilus assembly protein PilA
VCVYSHVHMAIEGNIGMATNWFYADSHNQQQGPVDKAWLVEAYGAGTVRADTLVWREGLSGWVPLRQVGAQIGLMIVGGVPPVPVQGARSSARVAKPSSSSSWVIVAVVVGIVVVAFIGILAAIALPAYNDYVWRAKVSEALVQGTSLRSDVLEFRETQKRCPVNGEGGIGTPDSYATPTVASIDVGPLKGNGDCAITITLANVALRDLAGKQLQFALNAEGQWRTNSDVPPRFLPRSMRESPSQ